MKYKAVIFNDFDLEKLLPRNLPGQKKSLILYFLTLPAFADIVYLPQSLISDDEFIKPVIDFLLNIKVKVGISMNVKVIDTDDGLEFFVNTFPEIQRYYSKYQISGIHCKLPFGKRKIQKSPKFDEYILHSQNNWTNVAVILQWCKKNNLDLLIEPNLNFFENSSEDFYIHMRQILWDGTDIFRRLGLKFNQMKLIIPPFYPVLKGLRDTDILDPANIANTTLRCISECLTKERMEVYTRGCFEMGLTGFEKYLKFMKTYGKDVKPEGIFTCDCLREYVKIWDFQESNLKNAQESIFNSFLT